MPLVDMSVEELFKYNGSSPCPKDFDEYWDDALKEMNSLDYKEEFIKKEFPSKIADMYDLYYTGTNGARIHAKVAVPKNIEGRVPAVLMFHGLGWRSCDWHEMLVPQIKKCAVFYPYLSDFKRLYEMDLNIGAYEGLKNYFRFFDPTHEREEEIFERLGYIDIQNLAKRMKAELLMFTGLMDTTCPPSTQFAMYNKVTSKKNVIFYPEYGHEGMLCSGDKIFEFFSDL